MLSLPTQPGARFPWELGIFPLLEMGFFAASVVAVESSVAWAAAFMVMGAVSLSFSIHIFFHECVHSRARYPAWFNWAATSLMGLPFDGYRIHHYNHHAFENGPRDFSSTWRYAVARRHPYSAFAYALGWPRQLAAGVNCKLPFGDTPTAADKIKQRIPAQKIALVVTLLAALACGWQSLMLYIGMIYLGWVFTSLHNYGQHLPVAATGVTTYASPLYNALFFNNGLHWEHHASPGLPWQGLAVNERSHRIGYPHIITSLLPTREAEIGKSI